MTSRVEANLRFRFVQTNRLLSSWGETMELETAHVSGGPASGAVACGRYDPGLAVDPHRTSGPTTSAGAARLLADATVRLHGATDFEQVMARLASSLVPEIADWAVAYRIDGGQRTQVAAAHRRAESTPLVSALAARPLPQEGEGCLSRVARCGEPEMHSEIDAAWLAHAMGADAAAVAELEPQSCLLVPIRLREAVVAVVIAVYAAGKRHGPPELQLAASLAACAESALVQVSVLAQALGAVRARDQLLAVASHELRTPLSALRLQLSVIERLAADAELDIALRGKIQLSHRQIEHLGELLDVLLDVSQLSSGRLPLAPARMDLAGMAADLGERLRDQAASVGCELRTRAEGEVCGCWDRLRLEQAVTNLLSNAMKYGAGRPIEVAVRGDGERAILSVRDYGIGITPEHIKCIFGLFARAVTEPRYGGLGLGLFLTREIIEAHGGSIGVDSQPGAGATFTICLPKVAGRPV
jgi:signal transduction histidine kinase